MDNSTIGQPSEEPINDGHHGLTRRQVGVAAAWALPVIATATAAPLAAASIQDDGTIVEIQTETSLSGNEEADSPISGAAGGDVIITNVGNAWTAAPITARYRLTGPLDVDSSTLLYNGNPITAPGPITIGADVWTVNYAGSATGGWLVYLQRSGALTVPANGSVTVTLPVITFATVANGVPTVYNPTRWQLEVGALEDAGNPSVSISSSTGKSIPAV